MGDLAIRTRPFAERPTSRLSVPAIELATEAFLRRAESIRGLAGRTCGDEENTLILQKH